LKSKFHLILLVLGCAEFSAVAMWLLRSSFSALLYGC